MNKKSQPPVVLFLALGVAGLVGLLGAASLFFLLRSKPVQADQDQAAGQLAVQKQPVQEIVGIYDATGFYGLFTRNPAKAEQDHTGKMVTVQGYVRRIEKDPSGNYNVHLDTGYEGQPPGLDLRGDYFVCSLSPSEAAKTKTDSGLRLKGICKGMSRRYLIFVECQTVESYAGWPPALKDDEIPKL